MQLAEIIDRPRVSYTQETKRQAGLDVGVMDVLATIGSWDFADLLAGRKGVPIECDADPLSATPQRLGIKKGCAKDFELVSEAPRGKSADTLRTRAWPTKALRKWLANFGRGRDPHPSVLEPFECQSSPVVCNLDFAPLLLNATEDERHLGCIRVVSVLDELTKRDTPLVHQLFAELEKKRRIHGEPQFADVCGFVTPLGRHVIGATPLLPICYVNACAHEARPADSTSQVGPGRALLLEAAQPANGIGLRRTRRGGIVIGGRPRCLPKKLVPGLSPPRDRKDQ